MSFYGKDVTQKHSNNFTSYWPIFMIKSKKSHWSIEILFWNNSQNLPKKTVPASLINAQVFFWEFWNIFQKSLSTKYLLGNCSWLWSEVATGCILWKKMLSKLFLKFKGKYLCWSLFLIKMQALGLQRYIKK